MAQEAPIVFPSATLPASIDDVKDLFLSATAHKNYTLGQRVTLKDVIDQEDDTVGRKRTGSHSIRGAASLTDLINSGLLTPGENRVHISYKGHNVSATLTADGGIEYQGKRYQSATAFSIFFKRTITPSKLGDDGWKSVLYEGKPLEHYRHVYLDRKSAANGSDSDGEDDRPDEGDIEDDEEDEDDDEDDIELADNSDDDMLPAIPEFEFTINDELIGAGPMDFALPSTTPAAAAAAAAATPVPAVGVASKGTGGSQKAPKSRVSAGGKMSATGKKAGSSTKKAPASGAKSTGRGKAAKAAAVAPPPIAPALAAAVPVKEDWVCCERCEQWRMVPPEKWAAVQADTREEWYCEYATWDVKTMQPFTPACPMPP